MLSAGALGGPPPAPALSGGQVLDHHQFFDDRPDEIRIVALVEPEVVLGQVLLQQPRGHRVMARLDIRLRMGPLALDGLRVDVGPADEGLGMIDDLMVVPVALQARVAPQAIGVDRAPLLDVAADDPPQGLGLEVGHNDGFDAAVALAQAHDRRLARRSPAPFALAPPAVVGLIHLDLATEREEEPIRAHGLPHGAQHGPSGLVGDAEGILEREGRDPVLPQADGQQPLRQGGPGRLEDGPAGIREVVPAGLAAVASACGLPHGPDPRMLALRATDSLGPSDAPDQRHTCLFTGDVLPVVIQAHAHGGFGAFGSASAMTISEKHSYPRRG